jgi:hypothetical protein
MLIVCVVGCAKVIGTLFIQINYLVICQTKDFRVCQKRSGNAQLQ